MNVATPTINALSIFSGSGMLDTAAGLACDVAGYRLRTVGYVERDAAAAAFLLARMEAATLERAPVWCDCLSRVDARPLRGWVDILLASPPCQPYSSAGKRRGNADERSFGDGDGPLPNLARIIDECRPALVFLENVPEWFTDGHFRGFGEELCGMGFDITPPLFLSSGCLGSPHGRERVFCVAHAPRGQRQSWPQRFGLCETGFNLADTGRNGGSRPRLQEQFKAGASSRNGCGEVVNPERPDSRPGDATEQSSDARNNNGHRSAKPGHCVAEPPRGGCGEVRESSGFGGQPNGRRVDLGDANGLHQGGWQDAERGPERGDVAPRASGRVANGASDRRSQYERRAWTDDQPDLAHGGHPLVPPGRPLFDDELAEVIGRDSTTLGALKVRVAGTAHALRQWAALAAAGLDPTLMPAIERGVPVVADALAASTSDLLRIGGNGVDVLVAAYAFHALVFGHVFNISQPAGRVVGLT